MRGFGFVGVRGVRLVVGLAVVCVGVVGWCVPAFAGSGFAFVSGFAAPPGGFGAPAGVVVNGSGGLLGGKVYVVDPGRSVLEEFGPLGEWEGNSVAVVGASPWLGVDQVGLGEGEVYVAVPGSGVVDRFSPVLFPEGQIKGLSEPTGVAVNSAGDVLVSEAGAGVVLEFNASGEPIDATGKLSASNTVISGLSAPQALAVSTTGEVYAATSEGTVAFTLSVVVFIRVWNRRWTRGLVVSRWRVRRVCSWIGVGNSWSTSRVF